ncbi:pseudouridine synthase [Multifurca ochricompacta]|uniref:Pseudouridine synthase n=1 Tax=Multifurca ochricompacta TaxID=376703 RepID=A0AAD4MBV1_9AGAM|nr:pseudouridine synthase [Multifurca ochricompacta]
MNALTSSSSMNSVSPRSHERESLDDPAEVPPSKKLKATNDQETILPPSHSLLGTTPPQQDENGSIIRLMESDVGISEYISKNVPKIGGIIKQRFTDFLVYEVDQDNNVVHVKSLGIPLPPARNAMNVEKTLSEFNTDLLETTREGATEKAPSSALKTPWPDFFTTRLAPFLCAEKIEDVKQMFLEGPDPPFVSDAGWAGRPASEVNSRTVSNSPVTEENVESRKEDESKKGGGKRGRGRGGRGGGGRSGKPVREDHRRVISDPIVSKQTRTSFHQIVRELFDGKLESETEVSEPADIGDGSPIVIRWARRGSGGGGGRGGTRNERAPRGTYPPYIHFTLQKTNRDTQDALQYLARTLHVPVKDLSTAGTKDKRGVTVQRVALRRGAKTVEDVWNLANGRERGVRIADLIYRRAALELGMLKGNAFVITLRNVRVDSIETLDNAMNSIKKHGFINYYGMQRFGTAAIPTHSIGLALLKSDWHLAVSLILRPRPGEHPDVLAARRAAERCILESYKKQHGDTRNALGALSTIPRNLRLMYVHAYQSYVWNAIVSERIKTWGADKPVPGDLVLESGTDGQVDVGDDMDGEASTQPGVTLAIPEEPSIGRKNNRKPWQPPRVKTLTEEDIEKYSIFDVVMPLPGNDVAFPGGALGKKYREYLIRDGLDPDNFQRRQRDYTLSGSYRNILHLPKEISWSVLRYTDPDVPLAQSDEDQLLGYDPPAPALDGRFLALQIRLILGTAAYATMALREVTKTDTSSHFQSSLTQASEDQRFKGANGEDLDQPMGGI